MIRLLSHGVKGNALKYQVSDFSGQILYDLDVELQDGGKFIHLQMRNGLELGFVYMSTLETGTSAWIGLHEKLVGSVCLKRSGEEFCITIPCWTIEGEPYRGDFSILKSGNVKVSVCADENGGIPYERLDIADDSEEHLLLLLVLAIEEAIIGRQKKSKKSKR